MPLLSIAAEFIQIFVRDISLALKKNQDAEKDWRRKKIHSEAKQISVSALMRPFDVINCRAIIDLHQKLEIIMMWRTHIYDEGLVIFWVLFLFIFSKAFLGLDSASKTKVLCSQVGVLLQNMSLHMRLFQ